MLAPMTIACSRLTVVGLDIGATYSFVLIDLDIGTANLAILVSLDVGLRFRELVFFVRQLSTSMDHFAAIEG